MKVTVKDCLELDAFKGAEVSAGKNHLNREVRTVSALDVCDESALATVKGAKGELLLTGFLGSLQDVQEQCNLVARAAKEGCAAVAVFGVGSTLPSIDNLVVGEAENRGIALIRMAEGINYSKVISEVMDNVLYGDNFRNSLISNTIFHLLNFEKHSNFQAAVREAAINNDFQIILLSEDFNPIFAVETRHQVLLSDAIRLGRQKKLQHETNKVYTLINVDGALTYWGLVNIDSKKHYMLIVDNEDSYTAGEITKLAEIIELAIGMWKYTPERDAKSELIKALIRGNRSLAYNLQDEAKIDGADIVSVFFSKGANGENQTLAFAGFEKLTDMEIMSISEGDETYGMVLKTEKSAKSDTWPNDCATLFNKVKEIKAARVFHVTGVNGIEGAADAYKLICESWSFVQTVFPFKSVFTKYELALVNNCINIQIQGGFVRKNFIELLDSFSSAGEHKGKQLLETLETFVLDAGMSSSKTADLMDIHANTVQYRLKKINEMLGVEVTGNRIIPGLTMALALHRLEKAVS